MKKITCSYGHPYDSDMYSFCPVCAGASDLPGFTAGPGQAPGVTLPPDSYDDVGATAPVPSHFVPPTPPVGWGPDMTGGGTVPPYDVDGYEPTAPVELGTNFTPVVGWLVCTEGPDRGADYRIKAGYNYIGRKPSMDICIRNDNNISGEKNAVIIFDDVSNEFFFAHQNGSHPVRLNGKMVAFPTQIQAHDVLTIGRSKFLFVPLCGEEFSWNEEK